VPANDPDDISVRLERIKKLCDELDAAQGNVRKVHELVERMRIEAELFSQQLVTQDPTKHVGAKLPTPRPRT
jgi:hypothetical protein